MKRSKSGYYQYSNNKNNIYNTIKIIKKEKKLNKSKSENIFNFSKNEDNKIYSKQKSNFKEDFKIKNYDIKFNILNNFQKYNNIFNNNIYPKIINNNKQNKTINTKYHLKAKNDILNEEKYKTIKLNKNNFNENIKNNNENKDKRLSAKNNNYFPENFSLNIYKGTSFYRNRYKIESGPIQKALKSINKNDNSKKIKNINNTLKKNFNDISDNDLNKEIFKLLSTKRIDRFVNKLINSKNNSQNNTSSNKKQKNTFLTQRKKELSNDDINLSLNIHPYTNIINTNKTIKNRNNPIDKIKAKTANSGTQTINLDENKFFFGNINELEEKPNNIYNNNKFIINSPSANNGKNKEKNYGFKEIKFEIIKRPKNYFILKKYKKLMRTFSTSSHFRKNLNKENRLIFSFYNPNDKYIKLFEDLEKRIIDDYDYSNIKSKMI